uniref:Uncharacterized protein n=1 Tax=Arundo donax TaxID=35708 RepID=A0A0A9GN79_ARUDO
MNFWTAIPTLAFVDGFYSRAVCSPSVAWNGILLLCGSGRNVIPCLELYGLG